MLKFEIRVKLLTCCFFTDIQVVNIVFVSCPVGRIFRVILFDIREEGKWLFVLISKQLKCIVGPEYNEN